MRFRPRPCHTLYPLALVLLALAAGPARASGPREELLGLVPEDVGLVLVIGDLRAHHEKILRSPWIQALRESPFGQALASAPEVLKLGKLQEQISKHLNVTWAQLRDDILGDAVVFAYRPGPPGKPDDEQGLLLLWARNKELLATLVERLNREQKRAGELKEVQQREHRGRKYQRRVEAGGDTFYYLDGHVLVFTCQEDMLRRMLDRAARPQAPLPMQRQLEQVGTGKALANVWINPRAFDAELEHQAAQAAQVEPARARALKIFLTYWKAVEGVTLSLTLEKDPEIFLSVHARTQALPEPAQRLVAEASKTSDLWGRFPANSVLTLAGRMDPSDLLEVADGLFLANLHESAADLFERSVGLPLNKETLRDVLPHLGPDWGVCVAPSPEKGQCSHVLIALRIRPGKDGVAVDQTLMKTLHLLATLAVADHNRKHKDSPLHLRSVTQDGVDVNYLVNDKKFPPGFRPSFAVKDGYLLLASSPEAVARFGAPAGPLPSDRDGTLLMRLSLQELAQLLKERRAEVLSFLAERKQMPPQKAEDLLTRLVWGLGLFDRLELRQRTEVGQVFWVFRLITAVPKK